MFLSAAFAFIGANKKMDHGGKRYLGGQYVNTSPSRGESPSLADDDDDNDDGAQAPVQISTVVSLVLLVLLIIPL